MSQYQKDGILRPMAYVNRRVRDTKGRWSVSEIELLNVVYNVIYFRPLLYKRRFTIINDHVSLQ